MECHPWERHTCCKRSCLRSCGLHIVCRSNLPLACLPSQSWSPWEPRICYSASCWHSCGCYMKDTSNPLAACLKASTSSVMEKIGCSCLPSFPCPCPWACPWHEYPTAWPCAWASHSGCILCASDSSGSHTEGNSSCRRHHRHRHLLPRMGHCDA